MARSGSESISTQKSNITVMLSVADGALTASCCFLSFRMHSRFKSSRYNTSYHPLLTSTRVCIQALNVAPSMSYQWSDDRG